MMLLSQRFVLLCLGMVSIAMCPKGFAVSDETNQGRWSKPTDCAADKQVPGFLVNLGPTGARAELTKNNTFIVRYIFKDSPAVGHLKIGDEITGVFGKPFLPHHYQGYGYEGPIMDFGEAIEKAEGKDGKLVLNLTPGSSSKPKDEDKSGKLAKKSSTSSSASASNDVIIELEPIGAFSPTFPMFCKKSEILRAKALKFFVDHPEYRGDHSPSRAALSLAFFTSDDAKQQAIGKEMILRWASEMPGPNLWNWNISYQMITLGEYYLATKDAAVLPAIKAGGQILAAQQYGPRGSERIKIWGPGSWGPGKTKESPEMWLKVEGAQQLYDGGFGHGPYIPAYSPPTGGFGPNGYGPMQYPTIFAVTAWQLSERCGVPAPTDCIKRALDFIHRGTNASGYVAYGGEFTMNNGYVDPVSWKAGSGSTNYVGRTGAAIVAHRLSPEFPESADYLVKYRNYSKSIAVKSLPDGHADPGLGFFWGLIGNAASDDETVFRTAMDYYKYYFNMMRCFDGSYVVLPGRDYADDAYYHSSRTHPTATMILVFGLNNPKLLIQGVQVSIPGVNPKALKGKLDVAYKAIVAKNYSESAAAIKSARSVKSISDSDAAICNALSGYLDAQSVRYFSELEALEKRADYFALQAAVVKTRASFGLLEGFKEKIQHFEEGLLQDAWKAEIKLGARYVQLMNSLVRKPNQTKIKDLEAFAEKSPESIYGKWAEEVIKVYRDEGRIVDPSAPKASNPTSVAKPTK
jgi:Family of unknown function (DUF6288)